MSSILDNFTGEVPDGVDIDANILFALSETANMSAFEKAKWLESMVNSKEMWDYKRLDQVAINNGTKSMYEDFGNFHYGVVAKVLFDKEMVLAGAGAAQSIDKFKWTDDKFINLGISLTVNYIKNLDNAEDIPFVEAGIQAANEYLGLEDIDGLSYGDVAGSAILNKVIDYGEDILNNISKLISFEKNVYDLKKNDFLSESYYTSISEIITPYLINNVCYQPTIFDSISYVNPISIGAFYESSTSQIDNSMSIAQKTFKLLNSSNQTITKTQLNALDLNKDGIAQTNLISLVKSISNNRFYQANFYDLDLRKVA